MCAVVGSIIAWVSMWKNWQAVLEEVGLEWGMETKRLVVS